MMNCSIDNLLFLYIFPFHYFPLYLLPLLKRINKITFFIGLYSIYVLYLIYSLERFESSPFSYRSVVFVENSFWGLTVFQRVEVVLVVTDREELHVHALIWDVRPWLVLSLYLCLICFRINNDILSVQLPVILVQRPI